MIKKLSALFFSAATYLSIAFPALAAGVSIDPCPKSGIGSSSVGFRRLCNLDLADLGNFIRNSITILFILAVIIAVFFLIYGGIRWISSGGDKARLESARNIIVAAIIGLILVFLTYFILNIILQLFGLPVATSLNIPTLNQTN